MSLILGGVVFQGFEIPDKIHFGGKQQLAVHKLVGGQRVVDAMGPDPSDIQWSGRFRGPDAISRAQAIDAMRIDGAQVELSWLGLFYTVVISDFKAETEKAYEVPYSLTCVVVDDPGVTIGGMLSTLDSLVGGDLTQALGFVDLPALSTNAVAGLSAAISTAGGLQGAAASILAPVTLSAASAVSAIASDIAANDAGLTSASPDGADPTVLAGWLSGMGANMATQADLATAAGYVGRMAVNLSNGAV